MKLKRRNVSNNASRLLKRIAYAVRPPERDVDLVGMPIVVRDAFPYDPASKSSPATALQWANAARSVREFGGKVEVVERLNEPFRARIVDLAIRSHGGRAYKIVDQEGRRFDLREDMLIEVLARVGIGPGGTVNGEFVWGIADRKLCLVLMHGSVYTAMVAASQAIAAADAAHAAGTAPTASTLVVGRAYRKRDGSIHVYLGRCKAPDAQKPEHAFVELPCPPERYNMDELSEHANRSYFERRNAVADGWADWSWRMRCKWAWIDRYNETRQMTGLVDMANNITLMASPKFDIDVGEVEADFVAELRANATGRHGYKRSGMKMHDLAWEWEVRDQKPPNGYYWAVGDVNVSNARAQYRDLIVWL